MRNNFSKFTGALVAVTVMFFLQGCIKDTCTHKYSTYVYKPVYQPMSALRQVSVQAPKPVTANGKIFIKDNFIYLNEANKGFHIIDNSNPAAPKNIAFVSVPGCIDIAAKGNYLLADNYIDLVTFDISNPASISMVSRKENALPFRTYNYGFYDDSARGIITSFEKSELKESADCNENRSWWVSGGWLFSTVQSVGVSTVPTKANSNGQSGSLSRFALLNDYLYIASRYNINVINVANPVAPVKYEPVSASGEVETIYPFKNSLLLGTPTGMRIFSVANPEKPVYMSAVTHWRGCDPVVAENNTAYVTIRGGSPCGGDLNLLDVIDISNLSAPVRIKSYAMQNPYGLGVYNSTLGICDGSAGFVLYDATQSNNIRQLGSVKNIKVFDVIMDNNTALLVAADGLYQYNISNKNNPVLLSKIAITQP